VRLGDAVGVLAAEDDSESLPLTAGRDFLLFGLGADEDRRRLLFLEVAVATSSSSLELTVLDPTFVLPLALAVLAWHEVAPLLSSLPLAEALELSLASPPFFLSSSTLGFQ